MLLAGIVPTVFLQLIPFLVARQGMPITAPFDLARLGLAAPPVSAIEGVLQEPNPLVVDASED